MLSIAKNLYILQFANSKTRGFYFTFFYVIMVLSWIFGYAIAILELREYGEPVYYILLQCMSIVGSMIFLVLDNPFTPPESDIAHPKFLKNYGTLNSYINDRLPSEL